MRRRSATHEAPPSLSVFRHVAPPWRESLLRPTATSASAGKSGGKAERRKEANSFRRKSCSDHASVENRRAGDEIHRDGRHPPPKARRRHAQGQHFLRRLYQG